MSACILADTDAREKEAMFGSVGISQCGGSSIGWKWDNLITSTPIWSDEMWCWHYWSISNTADLDSVLTRKRALPADISINISVLAFTVSVSTISWWDYFLFWGPAQFKSKAICAYFCDFSDQYFIDVYLSVTHHWMNIKHICFALLSLMNIRTIPKFDDYA